MTIADDAIDRYYSLRPASYGYLESFDLSRDVSLDGASDYCLVLLTCALTGPEGGARLRLSFSGVRELRVGDLGGLLCLAIDVRSLQERQLEDIRYRVVETENDAFSFVCSGFEAALESPRSD